MNSLSKVGKDKFKGECAQKREAKNNTNKNDDANTNCMKQLVKQNKKHKWKMKALKILGNQDQDEGEDSREDENEDDAGD